MLMHLIRLAGTKCMWNEELEANRQRGIPGLAVLESSAFGDAAPCAGLRRLPRQVVTGGYCAA